MPCSMQFRKGPNAVRTGHTATFASLNLRKAGAKIPRTWAQGGAATEQVHGTYAYAKTANQRLSYCGWCWLLPKGQNARFGIRNHPNTHNTRTATHCRHHIAQCYSLGVRWRLASFGKSPAARRNQDGPTTPPKRRSAAGTALGTQLVVTSMAPSPAVRHPMKPAKSSDAKKSICA
jgi:hypothetical protein